MFEPEIYVNQCPVIPNGRNGLCSFSFWVIVQSSPFTKPLYRSHYFHGWYSKRHCFRGTYTFLPSPWWSPGWFSYLNQHSFWVLQRHLIATETEKRLFCEWGEVKMKWIIMMRCYSWNYSIYQRRNWSRMEYLLGLWCVLLLPSMIFIFSVGFVIAIGSNQ